MKTISGLILTTLLFTAVDAKAISAPQSVSPYECSRTLLNGKECGPWSSLFEVEDTIKDRAGVEERPYRWYSLPAPAVVKKIVLHGIRFDFDKYSIRSESYPILEENMSQLRQKGQVEILVVGHTDNYGTHEYNQTLSEQRAQSVLNYFTSKGLSASRVAVSGHGETQPVDTNETDSGRFNNRRIEIQITHQQVAQK